MLYAPDSFERIFVLLFSQLFTGRATTTINNGQLFFVIHTWYCLLWFIFIRSLYASFAYVLCRSDQRVFFAHTTFFKSIELQSLQKIITDFFYNDYNLWQFNNSDLNNFQNHLLTWFSNDAMFCESWIVISITNVVTVIFSDTANNVVRPPMTWRTCRYTFQTGGRNRTARLYKFVVVAR